MKKILLFVISGINSEFLNKNRAKLATLFQCIEPSFSQVECRPKNNSFNNKVNSSGSYDEVGILFDLSCKLFYFIFKDEVIPILK